MPALRGKGLRKVHGIHPPTFHPQKDRRLQVAEFCSARRRENPAASVDYFCTAAYIVNLFTGGANMELSGVIYTPSTNVKFAGNTEGGGSSYTSIIARTVQFTGTSYLGQDPSAAGFSFGGIGAGGISLVQ